MDSDLKKIKSALEAARQIAARHMSGPIEAQFKAGGDPVTLADTELDKVLKDHLCQNGDGWLSEETVDDLSRLEKQRVWIVDPLDGTREFVQGIGEWCISVALFENGSLSAAGILNPARDQLFLGSRQMAVTLNGQSVAVSNKADLQGARVLASRSEVNRGEWDRFMDGTFNIIPSGSVAYKLALVAAGIADATFTLTPKNEWDIAAGVLLIKASGGRVIDKEGRPFVFNRQNTLVTGLITSGPKLFEKLKDLTITSSSPK